MEGEPIATELCKFRKEHGKVTYKHPLDQKSTRCSGCKEIVNVERANWMQRDEGVKLDWGDSYYRRRYY